jgi:hypothetical protein
MAERPATRKPGTAPDGVNPSADVNETHGETGTGTPASTTAALANEANPTGAADVSTGKVGDDKVIQGQEHVLGDDPRRVAAQVGGFHDSLSGRQIDKDGNFLEGNLDDGNPVPEHRRVANNWPADQAALGNKNEREGNTAPAK